MRKNLSKLMIAAVLIALLMGLMIIPASADGEVMTDLTYTESGGTAGSWNKETAQSLTSKTLGYLCGGDVGIWFYTGNVGLQGSFYPSTSRKVYMECRVKDSDDLWSGILDTKARTYEGGFSVENGVYVQRTAGVTYTNTKKISDESTVNLYMRYKVETDDRDTSTSLPKGVLYYRFWAY